MDKNSFPSKNLLIILYACCFIGNGLILLAINDFLTDFSFKDINLMILYMVISSVLSILFATREYIKNNKKSINNYE